MGVTFLEIIIILMLSAFFSGMEIAFISSNKLLVELEKSNTSISSKILNIFYKKPNEFISTLLVGNNIALVVYGILMAEVINKFILDSSPIAGNEGAKVLFQTILSTLIVLVTGEFLPKTLFKINPNQMMQFFALPAFLFYIILYPISKFTSFLSRITLGLFGLKVNKNATEQAFTKIDLDNLIQSSIDSNNNDKEINDEIKIFSNALSFSNVKVRDCMIPRTEIEAVENNISIETLKNVFTESGYSKIPVYENNIDNIIGFIHSSEMFNNPPDWTKRIKEMPIVPETMPAQKLLKKFMQQQKSMAVVVDEFGGTSGLVTMEDLVEEIFGDIEDEHDSSSYTAKQISDNEYILSGRLEIEKANEMFNLQIPESEDYITIGGYILDMYQSFPKINEVIKTDRFEIKIIKTTAKKIELVRFKIIE